MVQLRDFCLLSTVLLFSVACCGSKLGDKERNKRATEQGNSVERGRIDELQDALFGGNVWVIACKKDSESMDPFSEAAKLFSKNKECNGQCFAGTLDCRRKLPSKK